MKARRGLVMGFAALVASGTASATGTMRCEGRIIDQGTVRRDVQQLCGAPSYVEQDNAYWFYDRGDEQFVTRVFFVEDAVEFIDSIPRDED